MPFTGGRVSSQAYLATLIILNSASIISSEFECNMTTPIPSPPGLPLVGNMFDIDPQDRMNSIMHLADIYGTAILPWQAARIN